MTKTHAPAIEKAPAPKKGGKVRRYVVKPGTNQGYITTTERQGSNPGYDGDGDEITPHPDLASVHAHLDQTFGGARKSPPSKKPAAKAPPPQWSQVGNQMLGQK